MAGNAGAFLVNGVNVNNTGYRQFLKITQIPHPTEIFVFLDEHPDSIDDGYFLNKDAVAGNGSYGVNPAGGAEWQDLPASYHNKAAAFSFADGHAALHRWNNSQTVQPAIPFAVSLPLPIPDHPATEQTDFEWVLSHMSIEN